MASINPPDPDNLPLHPDGPDEVTEGPRSREQDASGAVGGSDQAVPSEQPDQDQTDDGGLPADAGSVPTGSPVRDVRQPFGQL